MTDQVAGAAGARLALGGVRAATPYHRPLPPTGPARLVALRQLRSVITADVVRSIDAAVAAGWHVLDHEEIAEGYVVWMRTLVLEAVVEGVHTWRDAQP